ncbi:MAG: diguanylate cyclase [Pseudomonadota bacterium]
MSGWLFRVSLVCWWLAGWSGPAAASVWTDHRPVQFEMLSLADGLSDSTVFSISQDQRGRIWMGTSSGGANVFDCYRIEVFREDPDNPHSLSHSGAGEVLALREGGVLVGTWGGGLNRMRYVDGHFERVHLSDAPTHIQVMHQDRHGSVWIGSADSGLWTLEPGQAQPIQVLRPDGSNYGRVWSIAEDTNDLWVATEHALIRVGDDGDPIEPLQGWGWHPRALAYDGTRLWAADGERLYWLQDGVMQPVAGEFPLINTLAPSPDGPLLIGTLAGIHAVDGQGLRVAPFAGRELVLFPERQVRRFLFDRSGTTWIATREAGVIKALRTAKGFDGHRLETQLDTADALLELSPNDVLIGSRRGLWRLRHRAGERQYYRVRDSESHSIMRMAQHQGKVLFATRTGVLSFDPETERISNTRELAAHDGEMVTALNSDTNGGLDVGTWASGLYRYAADGSVQHYAPDSDRPIPDVAISDIEPDGQGGIWIGLWSAGAAHIDASGQVTSVQTDLLNINGNVHDLLPMDGTLWVATSFGLIEHDIDSGSSQRLALLPDFPNSAVQRLATGAERLWAATTRGLMAIELGSQSVTRYGRTDGLVVDEFFARSGHAGEDGRIYFGGLGGFVSFLPHEVDLELVPPTAHVVAAWVDRESVPIDDHVALPPLADSLRLRFIAADYRQAAANRFRWRLINTNQSSEEPWSPVSAEPEAVFFGLKPGHYRFELQAANSNGLWNAQATALTVSVLPAWWQTRWGQVGLLLLGVLLVWALSFWNTQRIRARNRELQLEVSEQTQALQQANRSLEVAASTDYLTRLLNRRGFLARVQSEGPVLQHFFAVMDVDNFKQFNDRYGHEIGDQVLQHVADLLRAGTRDDDLVARWGGEEFIVRLNAVNKLAALDAAERIRAAVSAGPPAEGLNLPPITVTIGLARHADGEPSMDAIRRADARLLMGKVQGKNRVVSAG